MFRNLGLDLNLPTEPALPAGDEFDEFVTLYNALRQIQDGLSEAAGLITLSEENRAAADIFELYLLGRHTITVFEAGTDIVVGQPCQVYNAGGEAKVRQPAQFYLVHALEGGNSSALSAGFMPLFNVSAGQKVACAGYGLEIPLPGAVPGQRFGLNSSFVIQAYSGKIAPYYTLSFLLLNKYYMQLGICINADKMFVCPTQWNSAE